MTETDDQVAERIAERGRGALLERLRPAFQEAAEAHADLIQLDSDELEEMVQRAADRADGLQWRRALASVATEELGIGLGEALAHPAVARAQAIVGAPSYEETLAELGAAREKAQAGDGTAQPEAEPDVVSEDAEELAVAEAEAAVEEASGSEAAESDVAEAEAAAEPDEAEADASSDELPDEAAPVADSSMLRVTAVHQSGIANLAPDEGGLELQLSENGLDIARDDGDVLGRLPWHEISAIEVPSPRGVRRRRKRDAQLVVKTAQGEATFSIPALTPEEFRELVTPVIGRYRPANGNS